MKRLAIGTISAGAAVAALIFLDRPVAYFALEHARSMGRVATWISAASSPLIVLPLLLILAAAHAGQRLVRRCLGLPVSERDTWLRLLVGSGCATLLAWLLKGVIGRARPAGDQLIPLAFRPFSFDDAFGSFPSAQAALVGAMLVFLTLEYPKYRWVVCLAASILCLTRILVPEHWLSDVIIGTLLGTLVAYSIQSIHREI